MQKELEELQPKLVVAQADNKKMMAVIEKESAEVEARSKIVREDEKVANEKAAEAQALKDEVQCSECYTCTCTLWLTTSCTVYVYLYNAFSI